MRAGAFWSLCAGLSLGLIGWPGAWGWAGWVWPWFWSKGFREPQPLGLGSFGLGLVSSQSLWLVPLLLQSHPFAVGPLALALGLRLLSWWLLLGLLWVWSRRTSRWSPQSLFFLCFPFLYLLQAWSGEFFPPMAWPVPSPVAQEPWLGLYGPGLPLWGTLGIEVCLVWAALLLGQRWGHKTLPLALLALGLPWFTGGLVLRPLPAGPVLKVAYLPRSGLLGVNPEEGPALEDVKTRTAKALALGVDLVVWPESALPDWGQSDLEILASLLGPGQGLLVGADRKQEGQSVQQGIFGLLGEEQFEFSLATTEAQVSQKGTLRRAGPLFPVHSFGLAPGLGFEPYGDGWYRQREAQAEGYVHLFSASGLSPLAKELLAGLGQAKGRQSFKPVLLVANGTLSGPLDTSLKGQDPGTWVPPMIGGVVELWGVEPVSPYYSFGWALLLPLGLTVTLLGLWRNKKPSLSKISATFVQSTPGSSP